MFKRLLKLKIPKHQSIFLWGARQTGKSLYLKTHFPKSAYFDFLQTKTLLRYTKAPHVFTEDVLALSENELHLPIVVDEVQKIPILLNEIHWLIENKKLSFILCGSSARQLKTQSTNLLGGRAWLYHFYPLVFPEIPNFDLLRALQHGLLPRNYLLDAESIPAALKAYVDIYLTEEIRNEGLVRDLPAFSRFLDVAGLCNAEMLNISNVSRDCHVDRKTAQGYFQILIDTWLGYFIYPYRHKIKRDLITATPKFYLFDVGIANYLSARNITELRGEAAGKSFEHFIFMELWAYKHLRQKRFDIFYWRTKTGLEVDFVLGSQRKIELAIEIKISAQVHKEDLSGLIACYDEHPGMQAIVISQDERPRKIVLDEKRHIMIYPWKTFLEKWWNGEIAI